MSHVLTEAAASANFGTGVTVPDHGDDFDDSCDVVVATVQQVVDREQWLKGWLPTTQRLRVPLISTVNSSSRFTQNTSSAYGFWTQTSVASVGLLGFPLGGLLPAGRRITSLIATVYNASTTNIAIGTKPFIELTRQDVVGGTFVSVASGSDTTAVLATYQGLHDITVTLNHTISDNYDYQIGFQGETGANSTTGLNLLRIAVVLSY